MKDDDLRKLAEANVKVSAGRVLSLLDRCEALQAFKDYVHGRLDAEGVPADPQPDQNAIHGCRIEGRLNYLTDRCERAERERDAAKVAIELSASGAFKIAERLEALREKARALNKSAQRIMRVSATETDFRVNTEAMANLRAELGE